MHGFGIGLSGLLGMILVWILLILGSVWLVKNLFSGTSSQPEKKEPAGEDPLEILKQRYARGELGREEFQAMKKDILAKE